MKYPKVKEGLRSLWHTKLQYEIRYNKPKGYKESTNVQCGQ